MAEPPMTAIPGMPTNPQEAAAMAETARRGNAEIWTYLVLGWLITSLRTYGRVKKGGWREMQPDDWMAWVAAFFYALESGAAYAVGTMSMGLANNGIPEEKRLWLSMNPDTPENQLRITGSKIQLIGWCTYSAMVWSLKASLLFFYLRLTSRTSGGARTRIFIGFGLVAASWLAFFLTIVAQCFPFEKNWQIYPNPGNHCQPASSRNTLWVSITLNIITDMYIMFTPIPMLLQSTLRPAKKAALVCLFCSGLFVMVCAIIRTTLMLTDPIKSGQIAGLWSCRETLVATFVTNLPAIMPLIKMWYAKFYGTMASSFGSTRGGTGNKLSGADTARDTFGARSANHKSFGRSTKGSSNKSRGGRDDTTLVDTVMMDSEEDLSAGRSSGGYGDKNIQMSCVVSTSPPTRPYGKGIGIRRDIEVDVRGEPMSNERPVVPRSPLHVTHEEKRDFEV